jgi:hypothetical protein
MMSPKGKSIMRTTAFLGVLALMGSALANPQSQPWGIYRRTCKNISVSEDVLSADCLIYKDEYVRTSLKAIRVAPTSQTEVANCRVRHGRGDRIWKPVEIQKSLDRHSKRRAGMVAQATEHASKTIKIAQATSKTAMAG